MDIIVTTPRGMMAEAAREAEDVKPAGGGYYFRRIGSSGAAVARGDKVFYVEDGFVRGYAVVDSAGYVGNDEICETTGRRYAPGFYVWMRAETWTWIKPIPMRGFQGWRYAGIGEPIVIVGGWMDPRPAEGYGGKG